MATTTTKAKYKSTQPALYATVRAILRSMLLYIAQFTAFKGKYDAAFVAAQQLKVDTAEAMKDDQQRGADAELFRTQLVTLNRTVLDNFQDLKSYINEVFLEVERKSQYEAAGQQYFNNGAENNWEKTKQLTVASISYIAANSVKLLNGGLNMPATFEPDYKADALDFVNKYDAFIDAKKQKDNTENKIVANNALYDLAQDLCLDGQKVFRSDAGKAEEFIYSKVLESIDPPGSASLNVTGLLSETGDPAKGAKFSYILEDDTVTNSIVLGLDGKGKVENADPGRYTWLLEMDGREPAKGLKEIGKGTNARLEIKLVEAGTVIPVTP